ncbi:hypothetical protein IID22_01760 [Patescibacteria group bacterium]|nr:hypothetical protein [Patescibacteria group bacterium]
MSEQLVDRLARSLLEELNPTEIQIAPIGRKRILWPEEIFPASHFGTAIRAKLADSDPKDLGAIVASREDMRNILTWTAAEVVASRMLEILADQDAESA